MVVEEPRSRPSSAGRRNGRKSRPGSAKARTSGKGSRPSSAKGRSAKTLKHAELVASLEQLETEEVDATTSLEYLRTHMGYPARTPKFKTALNCDAEHAVQRKHKKNEGKNFAELDDLAEREATHKRMQRREQERKLESDRRAAEANSAHKARELTAFMDSQASPEVIQQMHLATLKWQTAWRAFVARRELRSRLLIIKENWKRRIEQAAEIPANEEEVARLQIAHDEAYYRLQQRYQTREERLENVIAEKAWQQRLWRDMTRDKDAEAWRHVKNKKILAQKEQRRKDEQYKKVVPVISSSYIHHKEQLHVEAEMLKQESHSEIEWLIQQEFEVEQLSAIGSLISEEHYERNKAVMEYAYNRDKLYWDINLLMELATFEVQESSNRQTLCAVWDAHMEKMAAARSDGKDEIEANLRKRIWENELNREKEDRDNFPAEELGYRVLIEVEQDLVWNKLMYSFKEGSVEVWINEYWRIIDYTDAGMRWCKTRHLQLRNDIMEQENKFRKLIYSDERLSRDIQYSEHLIELEEEEEQSRKLIVQDRRFLLECLIAEKEEHWQFLQERTAVRLQAVVRAFLDRRIKLPFLKRLKRSNLLSTRRTLRKLAEVSESQHMLEEDEHSWNVHQYLYELDQTNTIWSNIRKTHVNVDLAHGLEWNNMIHDFFHGVLVTQPGILGLCELCELDFRYTIIYEYERSWDQLLKLNINKVAKQYFQSAGHTWNIKMVLQAEVSQRDDMVELQEFERKNLIGWERDAYEQSKRTETHVAKIANEHHQSYQLAYDTLRLRAKKKVEELQTYENIKRITLKEEEGVYRKLIWDNINNTLAEPLWQLRKAAAKMAASCHVRSRKLNLDGFRIHDEIAADEDEHWNQIVELFHEETVIVRLNRLSRKRTPHTPATATQQSSSKRTLLDPLQISGMRPSTLSSSSSSIMDSSLGYTHNGMNGSLTSPTSSTAVLSPITPILLKQHKPSSCDPAAAVKGSAAPPLRTRPSSASKCNPHLLPVRIPPAVSPVVSPSSSSSAMFPVPSSVGRNGVAAPKHCGKGGGVATKQLPALAANLAVAAPI